MVETSNGFGRAGGLRAIRTIVAQRQVPYVFETISYTTDELDNPDEQVTEYTEDVWFYNDDIRMVQELVGERNVGELTALTTAPTKIERDDRVRYNGTEYDALRTVALPSDNPSLFLIQFDRRQDAE